MPALPCPVRAYHGRGQLRASGYRSGDRAGRARRSSHGSQAGPQWPPLAGRGRMEATLAGRTTTADSQPGRGRRDGTEEEQVPARPGHGLRRPRPPAGGVSRRDGARRGRGLLREHGEARRSSTPRRRPVPRWPTPGRRRHPSRRRARQGRSRWWPPAPPEGERGWPPRPRRPPTPGSRSCAARRRRRRAASSRSWRSSPPSPVRSASSPRSSRAAAAHSDNWQSSYVPTPAPTPVRTADDAGAAGPDEAISDATDEPRPSTTPDDPAEVVDLETPVKDAPAPRKK